MKETNGPQGAVDKPFLLQEGRVGLRASLDRSIYGHGEKVVVTVHIRNDSRKTVRRIRVSEWPLDLLVTEVISSPPHSLFGSVCLLQVFAIQHVDVCMFNNGKFKNIVADVEQDDHSVGPGASLNTTYKLLPKRGKYLFLPQQVLLRRISLACLLDLISAGLSIHWAFQFFFSCGRKEDQLGFTFDDFEPIIYKSY